MNKSALKVFVGFTVMLGVAAALLIRVQSHYVLGKPGVKVVPVPIFGEDSNQVANASVYLPEKLEGYTSFPLPVTKMELAMLPPDTVYGRRAYVGSDGFNTSASVVLMGTDRTSIHKPQYCLVGQGETILGSEVITIPLAKPFPYELKVMKLATTSQQRGRDGRFRPVSGVFLYWFVADGQLTPFHGERMWWMAKDMLTKGLLQRWAYVAYFARCEQGQESIMLERMKRFIAASVPEFQIAPATQGAVAASPARPDVTLANN